MLLNATRCDESVYEFTTSDDKVYLAFHHDLNEHEKLIHIVEVDEGQEDMYEFVRETFSTKVWVKDSFWLSILMYSLADYIIAADLPLDKPEPLYYTMGGYVEGASLPEIVDRGLVN